MKKLIVISHDFPGLGGSVRYNLVKFLPNFGYHPIVISNRTRKDPREERIIAEELKDNFTLFNTLCMNKSPFRVFSKFFHSWETTAYFERMFFIPDLYVNWLPSTVMRGISILRREDIAAILTLSPPESIHLSGLLLKKYSGVKWITNFADLWTTKKVVFRPTTVVHEKIIKWMEKQVYAQADHIIANTKGNREIYLNDFQLSEEKTSVIPGGYDPSEFSVKFEARTEAERHEFTIGYMGTFDKRGLPWKEFLSAVKSLVASREGIKLRVNLCGYITNETLQFIRKAGMDTYVISHGMLTHADAIRLMKKSDLLLILLYETPYSFAIVPHKLYYSLRMNIPILSVSEENGEVADIINRTQTGKVVSINRKEGIFKLLTDYYNEWKTSGGIKYLPNPCEIEKHNVMNHTEKLVKIIEGNNI